MAAVVLATDSPWADLSKGNKVPMPPDRDEFGKMPGLAVQIRGTSETIECDSGREDSRARIRLLLRLYSKQAVNKCGHERWRGQISAGL